MECRIFSRFWYVRTDTHAYTAEGYVAIASAQESPRDVALELFTRDQVLAAKAILEDHKLGTARAISVTRYRRAK